MDFFYLLFTIIYYLYFVLVLHHIKGKTVEFQKISLFNFPLRRGIDRGVGGQGSGQPVLTSGNIKHS